MKIRIILLLIICVACFSAAFAQKDSNHGLVLRGQIYDGKSEQLTDCVVWKARLAMEFVNTGKETIIIINPGREFGQWQSEVSFFSNKGGLQESLFIFIKKIERPQNSAEQKILAEDLDVKEPPQNLTIILKPNESFGFEDVLEVKQKFTTAKDSANATFEGSGYSVRMLRYLQIKYEFSLVKYQINPDLLEILQVRWRKFGVLPVDTNGGFSITSEIITNTVHWE